MMEDWVECQLGDLCDFVGGGTPSKKEKAYWNGSIPWASIKDIKGVELVSTIDTITQKGLENSSANIAEKGEIILATRIAPGKAVISRIRTSINQDLKIVKPRIKIDTQFLALAFRELGPKILKLSSGTTVLGINLNNLRSIPIIVPPLPIQRAIVARIEALFSRLDQGIADLQRAQAQLKVYRQAVLKKAFEGELTREWREQQTDLPSAEELLAQIEEERQRYYEQQLEEWKQAVEDWEMEGKVGKKPRKPSKPNLSTIKDSKSELPCNWINGQLEFIAEAIDPQPSHRTPPKEKEGIPYVSIKDIDKVSGKINFESARKVSQKVLVEHIQRYSLDEGDFVIGKIGTIGKPFFIPSERFFALSANVVLIKPIPDLANPRYLFYLNQSSLIELQFKKGARATTQSAFGIKKVRLLNIPICSVKEQFQIVKEIEARLSICDQVEASIQDSLAKAEALRQSILKKAFAGELLSAGEIAACKKEADYEPAAVLLERIRGATRT